MDRKEALLELERRGKLPEKYAPILNEMRSRGMVPQLETQAPQPKKDGGFFGFEGPSDFNKAITSAMSRTPAASFGRSAANSAVFDGGDEALAALGVGEGDTYSERQRDLQKTIDRDYRENPIASYAGNVVGSVVPLAASVLATSGSGGAAAPSVAASGARTLGAMSKLGSNLARALAPQTTKAAVASSALQGAASGYLGADQDTRGIGTGIGAVAGPVGDLALRGLTKGAQSVKDLLMSSPNQTPLMSKMTDVIDSAGGVEKVKGNFDRLASEDTMLVDALGNVGGNEARRVANLDMSVRDNLSNTLLDRHLGSNKRLSNVIEEASGLEVGGSATPKSIMSDLDNAYRPEINAAYKEARSIDNGPQEFIITPEIQDAPVFQKAMGNVDQTVANLRATNPEIDPDNPFDRLDALKKNLDDIGYTADSFGRSMPAAGNEAKAARDLSKNILNIADDSFPAYKAARDLHREKVLKQQSTALGQKLGRKATNRDVINAIQDPTLDPDFIRKGYGAQASQSLLDRKDGKNAIDFIDAGNKEAFDKLYTPSQLEGIQSQIARERAFNDTRNAVTANSSTTSQIADLLGDATAGIGTTLAGVTMGVDGGSSALLGAAAGLGKNALRKTFKNRALARDRQLAPQIAEMLMRKQFPQEIIDAQNNALRQEMIRNIMARAAAQPSSQTAVDFYRENR